MKRFLTVVFFVFFTFLFTLLFFLGELKFYVLTPSFVKDPLRENKVYEKVLTKQDLLGQELFGKYYGEAQANMPEAATRLTDAMRKSVDQVWFQTEFEKAVDALYRYATSDDKALKLSIDLRKFKSNLRKNLNVWMLEEYNKLPEVPLEEFDRQVAEKKGEPFPTVRPQGMPMEQALARAGINPIDMIMTKIPDKYDKNYIDKNKPEQMEGLAGFKQAKTVLYVLTIAFYVLLLIIILLLLLAAKLTSKSRPEFFYKLGLYMIAALVPFTVFVISRFVLKDIALVQALSLVKIPVVAREELLVPVVESVINKVFLHLSVLSGIVWAGGAAIVAATVIKKRLAHE